MNDPAGLGVGHSTYPVRLSSGRPIRFSWHDQFLELCFILIRRWFLTIGLCLVTLLVMWYFSDEYMDTLTQGNKKSVYNVLITGLAIGIAANLNVRVNSRSSSFPHED